MSNQSIEGLVPSDVASVYAEERLMEYSAMLSGMKGVVLGGPGEDGSEGEGSELVDAQVDEQFSELVGRLSSLGRGDLARRFRKSRAPTGTYSRAGDDVRERAFNVTRTVSLATMDDVDQVVAALGSGRVFANVVGPTAVGKSTALPGKIADMGKRVLVLEHDTSLIADTRAYMRLHGEARIRASVAGSFEPRIYLMTYDDFRASFRSDEGDRILSAVDVIIMDEAHEPLASVSFVRALLASHRTAKCSLLMMTATPVVGDDAQGLNATTSVEEEESLFKLVESGAFATGKRCVDRTMLIFGAEWEAHEAAAKLEAHGHEVYCLDSMSLRRHVGDVRQALLVDSCVTRFLVVTSRFSTGYTFPVTHVYSDECRVENIRHEDGTVTTRVAPITVAEAKQHAGRANRWPGFAGVYHSAPRAGRAVRNVPLLQTQQFEHYLSLRAAGIIPLNKPPASMVPVDVTSDAAVDLLAAGMHPCIAIRFMARDGKVPANYIRGLRLFSEPGHRFAVSKHAQPLDEHKWPSVPLGGVYGIQESSKEVRVPFVTDDEAVMAKLMAVCSMAQLGTELTPMAPFVEELQSESEDSAARAFKARAMPRVRAPSPVRLEGQCEPEVWKFDVKDGRRRRRHALSGSHYFDESVMKSFRELDGENVVDDPKLAVANTASAVAGEVDVLDVPREGVDVETPGGTVVCTLPRSTWECLAVGVAVPTSEIVSLIVAVRGKSEDFARSAAFAHWSNVWLGFLNSLSTQDAWEQLGLAPGHLQRHACLCLMSLYSRYQVAVEYVASTSMVKRRFWDFLLRRGATEALEHARLRGDVCVIQSQNFYRRVDEIRAAFAKVYAAGERANVYSPYAVTQVQQPLSISSTTGESVIDAARGRRVLNQLPVATGRRRMRFVGGRWQQVGDDPPVSERIRLGGRGRSRLYEGD